MEKSFSGTIRDRLGRKRCYRNGMPISCGQAEGVEESNTPEEDTQEDGYEQREVEGDGGDEQASGEEEGQSEASWDEIVAANEEEVANNDLSKYPYSQEELFAEQTWHKEFIDWMRANDPSEAEVGPITRFITGLLNPVMGGSPYIESLAEQSGVDMGETNFTWTLFHGFKWMLDDEETGLTVAKLAGNLLGEAAVAIFPPEEEESAGEGEEEETPLEEEPSHALGGGLRGLRRVGGRFSNLSHNEMGHRLGRSHEVRKNRKLKLQIEIDPEGEVEGQAVEKSLPYRVKAKTRLYSEGGGAETRLSHGPQEEGTRAGRSDEQLYVDSGGSRQVYRATIPKPPPAVSSDPNKPRLVIAPPKPPLPATRLGGRRSGDKNLRIRSSSYLPGEKGGRFRRNLVKMKSVGKPNKPPRPGFREDRKVEQEMRRDVRTPHVQEYHQARQAGRESGGRVGGIRASMGFIGKLPKIPKKALSAFNELSGGALVGATFKIPKNPRLKRTLLNHLFT